MRGKFNFQLEEILECSYKLDLQKCQIRFIRYVQEK